MGTALCKELDFDGNGKIDKAQFSNMMNNAKLRAYFGVQGLDIKDAEGFFQMLLEISGDSEVEIGHFVDGCMKMRGGATSLDMQALAFESRILAKRQKEFFRRLAWRISLLEEKLFAKLDANSQAFEL